MDKTKLSFQNLEFEKQAVGHESLVRVYFLRNFYFDLHEDELMLIGPYKLSGNSIVFSAPEQKVMRKFDMLLSVGFGRLKSILTGKNTVYIHKNSGIPLIGNNAFGIIDRNTSLIEIKPVTGCDLDCIFCSVDQDKRNVDFVVEKEYLVEELRALIKLKEAKQIQVFIGSQGETLIYADLVGLIKDVSRIEEVNEIVLSTNGTMLTEKMADALADAGVARINLSINSLDYEKSKKICGVNYNIRHIKKIAEYIAKSEKIDLMLTPVWIPGINDKDIEEIIAYAIKIGAGKKCSPVGVQKFLAYQYGKKPAKEDEWESFYAKLRQFEKKFNIALSGSFGNEIKIVKTKKLAKPFDKGDVVRANIVCDGRLPGEKIAVAKNRTISIMNCVGNKKGIVAVKITRS